MPNTESRIDRAPFLIVSFMFLIFNMIYGIYGYETAQSFNNSFFVFSFLGWLSVISLLCFFITKYHISQSFESFIKNKLGLEKEINLVEYVMGCIASGLVLRKFTDALLKNTDNLWAGTLLFLVFMVTMTFVSTFFVRVTDFSNVSNDDTFMDRFFLFCSISIYGVMAYGLLIISFRVG